MGGGRGEHSGPGCLSLGWGEEVKIKDGVFELGGGGGGR